MMKGLDIYIKYGDILESFSIYTDNIEVSLLELVHQSFLPSSSLPVKVLMGSEYSIEDKLNKIEGTLPNIREELRRRVRLMTSSQMIIESLEETISTAKEWFDN